MRINLTTICASAIALGLSCSANASPIVDSLGNYISSSKTESPADALHSVASQVAAESFVATSTSLSDVEVLLQSTSESGSIVVTLWTNSGNDPGTQLDSIGTVQLSSIDTANPALVSFTNLGVTGGKVTNLTVGTEYWIEVGTPNSPANGSTTNVLTTTSTYLTYGVASTAGAATDTDYFHGTGVGGTNPLMAVCIDTDGSCISLQTASVTMNETPSSNTPEPASLAIIGSGLAVIGFLRRPRTRRTAA
jgi:hypothetical protein